MKHTVLAVIVLSGLALAGCSGRPEPTRQAPTSPAPTKTTAAPQVMKFGEARVGKRGVITVAKPMTVELTADPQRAKDLTRGQKFEVTVKNTAQQALEASAFTFAATTDGGPASLLPDGQQPAGMKLSSDVLPGAERKLAIAVALPGKPTEVTIKITYDRANPLYWTGIV